MSGSPRLLAWTTAVATYLLIVLGAIVRITGSGMGCGDDWPLCNGRLFPSLDEPATMIEWTHRLVAAAVSMLVFGLAAVTWQQRGAWSRERAVPGRAGYLALGLLVLQVLLGAVTVRLGLPHWTVALHFATALLLLATLLVAATGWRPTPGASPGWPELVALALGFATVLLGNLTAKLGAASACLGFPLCNGQLVPEGNYLQHLHWTHRVLAYGLAAYVVGWAALARDARAPKIVLGLVLAQVAVAAAMVLGGLSAGLRAVHVALGTAVWGALVLAATAPRADVVAETVRVR